MRPFRPLSLSLRIAALLLLATGFFFVLFLRRPDILTNAQFWAEDGTIWFSDAWHYGIDSFLKKNAAYLQVFPRLVLGAATFLPLEYAPLFSNFAGLVCRVLPLLFLFSTRFLWAPLSARALFTAYYLLMPMLSEVHANTTNTQWYLGMYLLLILLAEKPATLWWKTHDGVAILLGACSGPFLVFLSPCLLLKTYATLPAEVQTFRPLDKLKTLIRALLQPFPVMYACLCLIQLVAFFLDESGRSRAPLGASVEVIANVLASRVFIGFLEPGCIEWLWKHPLFSMFIASASLACAGCVFWKGDWRIRIIILFTTILLTAAMVSPMVNATEPQLPLLKYSGERYFVLPSMGWMVVLLYVCFSRPRLQKRLLLCTLTLCVALSGLKYFSIPPLHDYNFAEQVRAFEAAAPGTRVTLHFPPAWTADLIKK